MKKIKRMIINATVALAGISLTGCGKSDLLKMLESGTRIEIEAAEPDFAKSEQGTESPIKWTQLAVLTTNDTLRAGWDDTLLITRIDDGKNGIFYVTPDGQHENNNTLSVAIHNRGFQKIFSDENTLESLASFVAEQYADVEASPDKNDILKQVYTGINGYFNLLPDNQTDYANPDSTLTRADFLAMVFRADTPVKELESDGLTDAVGENDLNIYAQGAVKDSYLDTESKSLNNMTYNGSITRAEAVYTLVSRYFSDELATVDTADIKFSDASDGGDIASSQKFDTAKDYWKSYELTYALQNPDKGMPTALYRALCVAQQKGFIGEDTRWDEAITKAEAVELLCKALMADDSIPTFDYAVAEITGNTVAGEENATDGDISHEYDEEYPDGLYEEPEEESTEMSTSSGDNTYYTSDYTPEEIASEKERAQELYDAGEIDQYLYESWMWELDHPGQVYPIPRSTSQSSQNTDAETYYEPDIVITPDEEDPFKDIYVPGEFAGVTVH